MTSEKTRYYRIAPHGDWGNAYVTTPEDAIDAIEALMGDAPEDEGYTVTVVYLTDAEIEALGEFDGF